MCSSPKVHGCPLSVCLVSAASAQRLSCEEHGALLNEKFRSIAPFLQLFFEGENFFNHSVTEW